MERMVPEQGGEAPALSCPPIFLQLLPSTTLWPLECCTHYPLTLQQSLTLPHPCPFYLPVHSLGPNLDVTGTLKPGRASSLLHNSPYHTKVRLPLSTATP